MTGAHPEVESPTAAPIAARRSIADPIRLPCAAHAKRPMAPVAIPANAVDETVYPLLASDWCPATT